MSVRLFPFSLYIWENEYRLAPKSLQFEGFYGHAIFVFSDSSIPCLLIKDTLDEKGQARDTRVHVTL